VTRRTIGGKHPNGWSPEQRITVEEALRAYTSSAAWAAFEENEKGTLSAGYLADFVVLSADLFAVEPGEMGRIEVEATVVGGRIAYPRK
jgi:predicted amidohydrolase YtcJ